ncbi:MAG: methylated-DNA--[protein]-cysteine S-methyltransferase [Firmicutes bacterium]|nr:methylated-DNA--[protein]-cysteine S-methyltransferase [Bacillota bacterium]
MSVNITEKVYITYYQTPLGEMLGMAGYGTIIGLWFVGQKYFPKDVLSCEERPDDPLLKQVGVWLNAYFRGENPATIDFSMTPFGSDFQQAVWAALREIPYGETTTYGALARRLSTALPQNGPSGTPASTSARAVGAAVGHNPVSILIPCHRVVGADGGLTGYAGGLERKAALLRLEGAR